jgi:hypothetical protein
LLKANEKPGGDTGEIHARRRGRYRGDTSEMAGKIQGHTDLLALELARLVYVVFLHVHLHLRLEPLPCEE